MTKITKIGTLFITKLYPLGPPHTSTEWPPQSWPIRLHVHSCIYHRVKYSRRLTFAIWWKVLPRPGSYCSLGKYGEYLPVELSDYNRSVGTVQLFLVIDFPASRSPPHWLHHIHKHGSTRDNRERTITVVLSKIANFKLMNTTTAYQQWR